MKNHKILTVIGARPQFVKAAVVSRVLTAHAEFTEIVVHTGQHFDTDMSDVFFKELDIPKPVYNLGIDSLSHAAMTGRMMESLDKVIIAENPDSVLVYGDTNSTLAGALTARKLHKKVIHVEAGLRSFDMKMPEEINRILTDRISDLLFCPTQTAVDNLINEGFENFSSQIINSGDVMFDAALFYRDKIRRQKREFCDNLPFEDFILCTVHREENTNDENILKEIFDALEEINRQIPVVLPLHPRTAKMLDLYKIKTGLHFIKPVGYLDMLCLLDKCSLVLTDSGGLQKEAYFLKKKCITLRDQTEWVELIESGCNFLAGKQKNKILESFKAVKNEQCDFEKNLYGDGRAAEKIVSIIKESF